MEIDKILVVHTIVDKSFYRAMNNNIQQVISYVQLAFMLANEIFKNADWPEEECKFVSGLTGALTECRTRQLVRYGAISY